MYSMVSVQSLKVSKSFAKKTVDKNLPIKTLLFGCGHTHFRNKIYQIQNFFLRQASPAKK